MKSRILLIIIAFAFTLPIQAQEDLDFSLLEACADSSVEKAYEFLQQGANPNARSIQGTTPLMYASAKGLSDLAMLLLDSGAQIQATEYYSGRSALTYAVMQNHLETSELLIRREAKTDVRDWEGNTLLHLAVQFQLPQMLDLLLYYDADVNSLNDDSLSALHMAAENGDEEIALQLIKAGINLEHKSLHGQTALFYAIELGQTNFAILLIEQGADATTLDLEGKNILHQACINGNYFLARQLIKNGFDINQEFGIERFGLSDYARISHDPYLRSFLKENKAKSFHRFYIDKIELHWKNSFNLSDYFMGGTVIAHESYTDVAVSLGFNSRLRREAVRVNPTYPAMQYWEKRHNLQLALTKNFPIFRYDGMTSGAFLEAGEMLSFGFWEGTNKRPDTRFIFYPAGGFYLQNYIGHAKAGIEYYQFPYHSGSPWHIYLQFGLNLKKYPF